MRTLLTILILLILSGAAFPGSDVTVSLIRSDMTGAVINVRVSSFDSEKRTAGNEVYDHISLENCNSLGETGQASLPTITKLVSIPAFKDVKVKILNSSFKIHSPYRVIPFQEFPLRNGWTAGFSKDDDYYRMASFMPEKIVSIKEIALLRDERVAVVTINPVQYNPSEGKLKVFYDLTFELSYEGYSDVNNPVMSRSSRTFEQIYRDVIFNYEPRPDTFSTPPELLIISADGLYNSILPFAAWKMNKGIRTDVKKKSELGYGPDPTEVQIRTYLINRYNSSSRPEFVILVADVSGPNFIPWYLGIGGRSDHQYSCLAGSDILPDIVVGRLSVQSPAELDKVVNNVVQYERRPDMLQTGWYKKAVVLHSNDGIDPVNGQVAKNVFLNEGGFTSVSVVRPGTPQSTITSYLNNGASWVWFIGHGSPTSWSSPLWPMSNMVNLNYNKMKPSIISIACANADLDYHPTNNCFAEEWVERDSVSSIPHMCASTENCAFYTTDTLGREMLYAYFRHGIFDFGSMMNFGKIKAYEYFNGNNTVQQTIHQFMVIGDPTLDIYSDIPKVLSVSLSQGDWPSVTFNVKSNGTNVYRALVALSQNDSLKASGYTDSSGNFSVASGMLNPNLPVNAVVTGRNLKTYENTFGLTGIAQNGNIPDRYYISQNHPNPFNPATVISYNIPEDIFVVIRVFDVLGREVMNPVNSEQKAGHHQLSFDGTNLPSGVYFYRISAGNFTETKKMTLLK